MLTAIAVAAALVVVAAGVWAWRLRGRLAATERRLRGAAGELEALQYAFSRFAPREVVDDIIAQGVSGRSATKDVTIVFADLHAFTALAEQLDPERLVGLLNGYFAAMERAIAEHRGHVAKFIGDGILAVFGALEPNPWQTNDALHAALAMRAALATYNRRLEADGLPTLRVGIGIHRGPVVTGVLGGTALVEYGVLGRAVNVAARVERLTRLHDADILVTEVVRDHADRRFRLRALPATTVKGLAEPLATFAVEGFDPGGAGTSEAVGSVA